MLVNTAVQFLKDRVKILSPCDHLGMNGPTTVSGSGGSVQLESGLVIEYDWYEFCIFLIEIFTLVPNKLILGPTFSN